MRKCRKGRSVRLEALEERQYLSGLTFQLNPLASPAIVAASAARPGLKNPLPISAQAHGRARPDARLKPIDYLNRQFELFVADYQSAFSKYQESLINGSTGTTVVTQVLTAPASAFSGLLAVTNAASFGTIDETSPIGITVKVGGITQGSYVATGTVGNNLILPSGPTADLPTGSTVEAVITFTDNTAALLPSFVIERVNLMAQRIVTYFNRLPIRLPKSPGPLRSPVQRNAIQFFVAQTLQGGGTESLLNGVLALPLPGQSTSANQLYQQTFASVIEQNRRTMIEGIRILFAGQSLANPVTPVIPAGQP